MCEKNNVTIFQCKNIPNRKKKKKIPVQIKYFKSSYLLYVDIIPLDAWCIDEGASDDALCDPLELTLSICKPGT
jgi:hypothetical protein